MPINIDIEVLRGMLTYEPDTGVVRWVRRRGMKPGSIAGYKADDTSGRYVKIKIFGRLYLMHRVAWAIHHGVWPTAFIDHKNMDGWDNRLCNLRLATNGQNMQNRRAQANNKSTGVKGVRAHKNGGFMAEITHAGVSHYLGYFQTVAEAKRVYDEAALRLHKEFARID